ncbi:PREDICTED: uncharacterized protein LOC106808402 [Priapulus caudatus]|uniref:Uncharacterized protein LOC106808402 n=1 Tax=Priapulus caudatus TaxID=37621 RepID=A0ABM1E328_PRICU|nr:PREDICTED: uncharacterized protein LOC106808402 [Priapulus caudatus]
MCARERASRIREAELNRTDPYQEKVKDNWVKIVEEMLVKRFHGVKKVAWDPVVEDKGISESEQDRKIRQIRTRSRRQSTIIVED